MKQMLRLCGRGLRYVKQYGPIGLYCKINERRMRDRAEIGYEEWLRDQLKKEEEASEKAKALARTGPLISILVPA